VTPPIVFLSDLGVRDETVGVCHAVMAGIAPASRVIDIGHGVPPTDVRAGALSLLQALPYLPADAVALAVVDPGSGSGRLALAVRTAAGRLLVGPDNGLLSYAWAADGGVATAVSIEAQDAMIAPVSPVLNARDVFSAAAAHLAQGRALESLGRVVDPGMLVTLTQLEPEIGTRRVAAEVIDVDRFGNVRLDVRPRHLLAAGLPPEVALEINSTAAGTRIRRVSTYGEVGDGECGMLEDAWGWLSLIRYQASAAELLNVGVGDPVWIAAAD
jgi:S-adenosylmethionine hydrolase